MQFRKAISLAHDFEGSDMIPQNQPRVTEVRPNDVTATAYYGDRHIVLRVVN
jgi:hypothetical protein